jgi:hypothetical protein
VKDLAQLQYSFDPGAPLIVLAHALRHTLSSRGKCQKQAILAGVEVGAS